MRDFLIHKGYVSDIACSIFLVTILSILIAVVIMKLLRFVNVAFDNEVADLIIFIVSGATFAGIIFIGTKAINAISTQYYIDYQNELYKHYDEYQESIINIIYNPDSKENEYELIISADNDTFKLNLNDNVAEFEEKVDTEADGDYYELHKDVDNKKVVLIKYTKEQEKASASVIKKIKANGVSQ